MKNELIAVPVFQERVSPLMDVSNRYMIYETEDGRIKQRIAISLNADGESQRVEKLKEIGVNTIICGAVSGYIAHLVSDRGMRLLSMIYGPIDEIITNYLQNTLGSYCSGGGCNGRKRQRRGQCGRDSGRARQKNASGERK
ncbi:MAG TPA: NifB/NifX family molybdenum-iron cluster-binding protein [Spirochaetota bacterium]|nr:NifB/NifX family molybdenum-iron cluster-binding protein [Spirochaetota bacterium]HPC39591.1 NifB/NifX family molybdenum-iron cluster-binding protein [Spirochaetota bacterium]HPL17743.1 NifB/NifX family molybdenum-iron cluster-binding protein [Spirochaetota bacterium]HQF09486.1 NifB/NifX family molybdenum-iron cluster-binding protein [Spirochaetota bacterium]HQH98169.1 NifB/NifX family molybdenum-iron cluster-binding protein [Spirochaetota bacterium]